MKLKLLGVLAIGLLTSLHAFSEVQINGFASVVMGVDLEDDGNPTGDYDGRVDNLQESRVALQWAADMGDGMRFVGQTMARGNDTDGFVLNYDWAYFDINVGNSGKLKMGRLRVPFYKYSDYLDVGYAYHWIAPPKSMYSLSFSNADGLSYQHNFTNGPLEHSVNVMFGRYQGTLKLGGSPTPGTLNNLVAVNWSGAIGNHEFYAAYAQAKLDIEAATLTTASASLGGNSVADLAADPNDVLMKGDLGSFVGVGYKGVFGDINVFAEYSIVTVEDSILQDSAGGYLGMSYGMGDYTYHLTYGVEEDTGQDIAASNALGAATTATLKTVGQTLGNRSNEGEATTITVGVRKDLGTSSAFKVDLSSYTEDRYQVTGDAAKSEETALLLRVALETMF